MVQVSAANATYYEHDGAGWISSAHNPAIGAAYYAYDAAGNRTRTHLAAPGVHAYYTYDAANALAPGGRLPPAVAGRRAGLRRQRQPPGASSAKVAARPSEAPRLDAGPDPASARGVVGQSLGRFEFLRLHDSGATRREAARKPPESPLGSALRRWVNPVTLRP